MAKEPEAGHWITVGEGEDAHHLLIAGGPGALRVLRRDGEGGAAKLTPVEPGSPEHLAAVTEQVNRTHRLAEIEGKTGAERLVARGSGRSGEEADRLKAAGFQYDSGRQTWEKALPAGDDDAARQAKGEAVRDLLGHAYALRPTRNDSRKKSAPTAHSSVGEVASTLRSWGVDPRHANLVTTDHFNYSAAAPHTAIPHPQIAAAEAEHEQKAAKAAGAKKPAGARLTFLHPYRDDGPAKGQTTQSQDGRYWVITKVEPTVRAEQSDDYRTVAHGRPAMPKEIAEHEERMRPVREAKATRREEFLRRNDAEYGVVRSSELTAKQRDKLGDDQYAVPETKQLPIPDAEHVRDALARFDQTDFPSEEAKVTARKRLLKAAKKYGVQVDAGDDAKRASQPSVSQVHVNAPLKQVRVASTHDEEEDDAKRGVPASTDDKDCDDKKMSDASAEDKDEDGDGVPDDEDPADQDDQADDDDDDAKPKDKQVDSTAGDDQDEGESEKAAEQPAEERPTRAFLTKMREHLSGKVSAEDLNAAIRHARAHAGGKGKAAKRMRAMAAGERDLSDFCAQGADYRLFLELRQAAEAPDWIPFLPTPGTYTHPQWGKIAVTRDRSQQFIDNFHAKVYQEHIPLDAEHQTKLSGAFAYLRDLRMNEDGSVDAQVEWTDRGKALVEADRFKYFSPEWFDTWTAPDTGKEHHNVIIGGAFTTRPFFKDASLRPLVASERGLEVVDGESVAARYTAEAPAPAGKEDKPMPHPTEQAAAQATEPKNAAEDPSKRFAELEAKFAASEQARQANEAALKQATEVIAGMQADARRKRFTEEVLGRGEQSGARWYGEPEKNVRLMERLADALGEDSKEFRSFVEQQRAVGAALRQSSLFSEIGSDASADADSPEAELDALTKKYQKQHGELTYEQAYSKVFSEHPEIQRRLARR